MEAFLALICFVGASGLSIRLGVHFGQFWKQPGLGMQRTACGLGFGASLLMLGISSGWLREGISFAALAGWMMASAVAGLLFTYLIASTAARWSDS